MKKPPQKTNKKMSLDDLARIIAGEFSRVHDKFAQIDAKLEGIDNRLDNMDNRFDDIDKRFDVLENGTHRRLTLVENTLKTFVKK